MESLSKNGHHIMVILLFKPKFFHLLCVLIKKFQHFVGELFVTFGIHYQHKEAPQLESRVMSTLHCPTAEVGLDLHDYWTTTIDALFSEWHVNPNRVTAVIVATNRSDLIQSLASKNFILVPCLMYSLQVIIILSIVYVFLFLICGSPLH